MKRVSLLLVIAFCGTLFSQNIGSRGLIHTQSARTFEKGQLEVHTNLNFFTRVTEYLGTDTQVEEDFSAVNYWLVASNLAITYGIIDNLDFFREGLLASLYSPSGLAKGAPPSILIDDIGA